MMASPAAALPVGRCKHATHYRSRHRFQRGVLLIILWIRIDLDLPRRDSDRAVGLGGSGRGFTGLRELRLGWERRLSGR